MTPNNPGDDTAILPMLTIPSQTSEDDASCLLLAWLQDLEPESNIELRQALDDCNLPIDTQ